MEPTKIDIYKCPICKALIGRSYELAKAHMDEPIDIALPVGLVYYRVFFNECPQLMGEIVGYNTAGSSPLGRGMQRKEMLERHPKCRGWLSETKYFQNESAHSYIQESRWFDAPRKQFHLESASSSAFRKELANGIVSLYSEEEFREWALKLEPLLPSNIPGPLPFIRTTPELDAIVANAAQGGR